MFQTKKKKIIHYLDSVPTEQFTAFDELLYDYSHGELSARLETAHISHLNYHIDWLDDYKCIVINGVCNQFFVDIQIEQTEFSIAYDVDEPDDCTFHALLGKEQFYQTVEKAVNEILQR